MAKRAKVKKEHPEDRRMREDGEAYARERGEAFVEHYATRICKLITTYADSDSEKEWWALRELFWTREWERRVLPKSMRGVRNNGTPWSP
jgi:hypothetical protein